MNKKTKELDLYSSYGMSDWSRDCASGSVLEKIIQTEFLKNCVDQLDVKTREIITLSFWHKFSLQDISVLMNIPKSTVRKMREAGLKRLFFIINEEKKYFESTQES